jgi:hypothetical protein
VVYARKLGGRVYTFQVSGKLWRNSLLMQDRQTESTWSHITGRAIDGKAKGAQLEKLASIETTWSRWRAEHPETSVLEKSEEIRTSHYQSYFENPDRLGLFRAQWLMDRMPGKTLVYGAAVGPHAVAATDTAFEDGGTVTVDLGGTTVVLVRGGDGGVRAWVADLNGVELEIAADSKTGKMLDRTGSEWDLVNGRCVAGSNEGSVLETVAVTPIYWFAWSNFYPNTKVVDGSEP